MFGEDSYVVIRRQSFLLQLTLLCAYSTIGSVVSTWMHQVSADVDMAVEEAMGIASVLISRLRTN